jgi:hypothetical protein
VPSEVNLIVTKCKNGVLAIAPTGKGYLVTAYGTDVAIGLIKGRICTMSEYFSKLFEQL